LTPISGTHRQAEHICRTLGRPEFPKTSSLGRLRWSPPRSLTSSNLGRPELDGYRRPEGQLGKVVASGDDAPLYFHSHLFSRVAELRSMFAIQI
jgi:hypothetical protein